VLVAAGRWASGAGPAVVALRDVRSGTRCSLGGVWKCLPSSARGADLTCWIGWVCVRVDRHTGRVTVDEARRRRVSSVVLAFAPRNSDPSKIQTELWPPKHERGTPAGLISILRAASGLLTRPIAEHCPTPPRIPGPHPGCYGHVTHVPDKFYHVPCYSHVVMAPATTLHCSHPIPY
jgi:hypothetical protein